MEPHESVGCIGQGAAWHGAVPAGFHWPSQDESAPFVVTPEPLTVKHAYFGAIVPVPHEAEHTEFALASGPQYENPLSIGTRTTGGCVMGTSVGYPVPLNGGSVSGAGHRTHGSVFVGRVSWMHLSRVAANEVTPVLPWQLTGRVRVPDPHDVEHTLHAEVT